MGSCVHTITLRHIYPLGHIIKATECAKFKELQGRGHVRRTPKDPIHLERTLFSPLGHRLPLPVWSFHVTVKPAGPPSLLAYWIFLYDAGTLFLRAGSSSGKLLEYRLYFRNMLVYDTEFRIASNAMVASMTVLAFDYLLTVGEEYRSIWKSKHTLIHALFYLNRYLPFVDTTLAFYAIFAEVSVEECLVIYITSTWVTAFGLMISELILLLRTWMLWERSRKIFIWLSLMSCSTFVPGIVVTVLEVISFRFEPVPDGAVGCHLVSSTKLIVAAYGLIAVSETVVMYLTISKGGWERINSRSKFVKTVYRHGLNFYFFLLLITVVNIIVPLVVRQPSYKIYLAVPQRVLHSILCNHVVLYIESQKTARDEPDDGLTRSQSIQKTNFTGNILESALPTTFPSRDLDSRDLSSHWRVDEQEFDEHEMSTYREDWT